MNKNDSEKKSIAWPFWIQIPIVATLPLIFIWCFSTAYEDIDWLYWFFHEVVGPLSNYQMLLCLPVGIIGLVMSRKTGRLREATIALAVINVVEFVLLVCYFLLLWFIIAGVMD